MAFLKGSLEGDQFLELCVQVSLAIHVCQTEKIPLAWLSYLHRSKETNRKVYHTGQKFYQ